MRSIHRHSLVALCVLASLGCDPPPPAEPELVCEPAAHRECECPVARGAQDCDVDGSGWSACICPVQSVVLSEETTAIDVDDATLSLDEAGALRFPRAGHDTLATLAEGDILVNWGSPPLLRRLTAAPRTEGDTVVLTTRVAGLQEAFDELDVEMTNTPINLYGGIPEGARGAFEMPRAGVAGGPSGLSFSASRELMPSLSFSDDSRIWFEPDVSLSLRTSVIPWNVDLEFTADLDAGFDLTSTAGLALEGRVGAEVELIEAIIANVVPPIRPPEIRVQMGPIYFAPKLIFGCELEVNGEVEVTSNVHTSFDLGAEVSYDDDRDGDNWASSSHAFVDGGAELLDFQWQAGARLTCYIRPRIEMTFLEGLTGYVQAGPEASASITVGPENVFSVDAAVVGTIGAELGIDVGEIEVTLAEREWEVYRTSTNLYREEFTICGDGYRQEGDGDDFREECDNGLFSDPTCTSDCRCGEGWVPVAFYPDRPVSFRSWATRPTMNVCVPSCGNGALEPDEGEACDPVLDGRRCGVGRPGCAVDCSRMEGVCGDGIVDSLCGEMCDDGNTDDCDTCSSDCMRTRGCGNGLVDWACGESCDDGNAVNDDACTNACRDPQCGNGVVDPREACDDGNIEDCDACHNDCTANANTCGDRHICGDEACDVGGVDTWDCDADCTRRECNDTYLNAFEACEGLSADCDVDCTFAECGDRTVNALAGEACDGEDWNCDADCTPRACGDGVVNAYAEECDDGNTAVCRGDCAPDCSALERTTTCGDGVVGCGEVCDEGSRNGTCGHCASDCMTRLGVCGDGTVTASCDEVCDDGNTTGGDGCAADCRGLEVCGDGHPDVGETCDDGSTVACNGNCNETCTAFYTDMCGDGVVTACELCEDTGSGIDLGCDDRTPNCADCGGCSEGLCGDGMVSIDEACEPSGSCTIDEARTCTVNADCGATGGTCRHFFYEGQCNERCTGIIRCGNMIIESGESCDDGNTMDGDDCSSLCTPT